MTTLFIGVQKFFTFFTFTWNQLISEMKKGNILSISRNILCSLVFTFFFFKLDVQAFDKVNLSGTLTNYFIATNGDDANPGTKKLPWKTLDKANQVLQPGDTVTLQDGRYSGIINPVSGNDSIGQFITYRSERRHGAILTGKERSDYIINLEKKHFIIIDGFMMTPESGGFGFIKNCSHVTLKNCHMEHSTKVFIQLHFFNSNYNRLQNNDICRVMVRTADSKINGDGCRFTNSSYNVIEGNSFSKIGHSPLNFYATSPQLCSYNIVRGNCFHNGWGRNFELFNPYRCLFENNVITDSFNGASSADPESKVFFFDGILRNCLIYDNWGIPLASNSYPARLSYYALGIETSTSGRPVPLELNNSRIYNNTFANNPTFVWGLSGNAELNPIHSNIFMNNLFSRNDYAGEFNTMMMVRPGCAGDNLFHNNLFFGEVLNQAGLYILDKRYTATVLNRELPARSGNNIDADPRFISLLDRCFALTEESPARNAGRPLTQALGSGSGKVLSVIDSRSFFDGFGIKGEQGDLIVVGRSKVIARVMKTDIEKNILTLDRDVSWKDGDPVSLPYSGSAPDIGAFQFGNTGVLTVVPRAQPALAGLEQTISFSALISGSSGAVNMEWDLGDGTITREKAPQHKYKEYGDFTIRLRCTDASGALSRGIFLVRVERTVDPKAPLMQTSFEEADFEEWGHLWDHGPSREDGTYYPELREDGKGQCMCITTEGDNKTLDTNLKMRIWDIDKYPFIRFSYRIPKDVPVGVWLDTWQSKSRPERICVGGSPKNSAGKYPNLDVCKLIDDGKWHDAVIDARIVRQLVPDIKLLHIFGFCTYSQTIEGQKFWFDDFAITP